MKATEVIHFKCLDAIRGLVALIVITAHTQGMLGYSGNDSFIQIGSIIAGPVAMPGFFLLSAFLLTYRLYHEMDHVSCEIKPLALIIGKYFIRRFMRIYLVFIIYVVFFSIILYFSSTGEHLKEKVLEFFRNIF